ncbi:NRPS [Arachnomyces sp. PD_36]|nr:NRPS [Arachnomyces sp. PD_36]
MSEAMDRGIQVGYTRFPNLSPEEHDVYQVTTISWGTNGERISLEALVISWAALLCSFTGEEHPTFILDGEPFQADLLSWSFEPISPDALLQDGGGYCGVFTNSIPESDDALDLAVSYDLTNGTGSLRSTAGINPSYLAQIGCQLKHCIRYELERERSQILIPIEESLSLSTLNSHPQILPGTQYLHGLISEKGSSLIAIDFLNDGSRNKLSYESLDRLSTRFASHLVAVLKASPQRQRPNEVIPILIPQSTNLYIALLAILKASASFCPLNLDAPSERISFILNDVTASVVVTTKEFAPKLQGVEHNVSIIYIDDDSERTRGWGTCSFKPPELNPDSLAYVMYTSGSTGVPKGVGVSHRAATQSLLAHDGLIPPFTRFLQFAATTFDVSVFEIFFPLFRGATLVGCERGMMLNDLPGIMRKLEVDASELTPTVATELLRSRKDVPSLRVLLTIGEMLTRRVVNEFGLSSQKAGILHGMYGPTEAAIHCTAASSFKTTSKVGIIGAPLPSVSAHIIAIEPPKFKHGDMLEVLPLGHIGELAVGGNQLASFYINRPEENAKVFIDSEQYGRVYRTGDRARMLPCGEIEILGRISGGQVKLRGQRLELGEIEHVICKADDVRNAVASVVHEILVVFVLLDNGRYSLEAIRRHCQHWLPKFMIPGDFVFLAELPRLPSGKIDKKALERNYVLQKQGTRNGVRDFVDASENKIAKCVGEILSAPISSSTSLSAAGLDSLTAIRLSSRLRTIGVPLDVVQILEADTVHELWLATRRADIQKIPSHSGLQNNDWDAISRAGFHQLTEKGWSSEAADVIPCSRTQESMLLESVKNPAAYFNEIELEFNEGIGSIKDAFRAVSQHNEILRSSFIEIDLDGYSYAQAIWKSLPYSRFSISSDSFSRNENATDRFTEPFRIQLDASGEKIKAIVHIHHALYDGWSWELILNDVQENLLGVGPRPRPQYRALTEFHQKLTNTEYFDSLGDYWQDQLQGIWPTLWPNYNDRSDIPADIAVSRRPLGISLSDVGTFSRELHIGRQTIFQAAFAYILSTYVGQDDVVFGSVSSGRTLAVGGVEDIIGPCITTLPMRLNIANSRSVRDLLAVIHTLNRDFLKYGALPLGDIKKASGVDPSSPLFDSLFIWQETLASREDSTQLFLETDTAEFLEFTMTLEIEVKGENLAAKASYLKSILPPDQVDIFLDQAEQVASLFLTFPDLLLTDVNSHLTDSVLSIVDDKYGEKRELPDLTSGVKRIANDNPEGVSSTPIFIVSGKQSSQFVPRGAIGELCFGGNHIGLGHLDCLQVTPNDFIDHPEYGKLYRSGDLGRLLPDGSIMFVGHHDDQIKVRGQYIDSKALSAALIKCSEIGNCIPLILEGDNSFLQQLVVFWVPARIGLLTEPPERVRNIIASLFDEISLVLPDYMIPSYLFPIQYIPMKPSGKANKTELIDMFRQRGLDDLQSYSRANQLESTGPKKQFSDIEKTITRILANIAHVQPTEIQKNTSFFSLGLNSLSAITFARRLRREGLGQVGISAVMRHSSVGRLANLISRIGANNASTSGSEIELEELFDKRFVERNKQHASEFGMNIRKVMPCTPLQEAMLSQKASGSSAYYNHLTFEILGDVDKLHGAWVRAKARHDILRTCFFTTDNPRYAFAQGVLEDIELPWERIKASHAEDLKPKVEARKAESSFPENTYAVPYSLTIFTNDRSRRSQLLLSIHHALYDAEAMSELLRDVENAYLGLELPTHMPFDTFLKKMVGANQEESDKFLDVYLTRHPTTSLTASLWGPKRPNTPKKYQREEYLPDLSVAWLERECKRMSMTILVLFQAAWVKLLALYTGQSEVCFGNVFSCRTLDIEGAEGIIGPCFNTLPVRTKFSVNSSNLNIIKDLQKSNADILPHQLSSLRRIQQRSSGDGSRLFDSLVLLQNSPRSLNENIWRLIEEEGDMDFPIVCEIIPHKQKDKIHISLHFDSEHAPPKDIRVLLEKYSQLILQILQFPSARAADPKALGDQSLRPLRTEKNIQPTTPHDWNQKPNGIPRAAEYSAEEFQLIELLARLSGIDSGYINTETTIFQLGLDSINAVQIAARLRERGYTISSGDVLETPSVGELASYLQNSNLPSRRQPRAFDFASFERKHWPSVYRALDVPESAVESLRPCTPIQAGMLATFLHSDGYIYFNHMVFKLRCPIRLPSLKEAWETVSERHEMLRTGFIEIQDEKCPFGMVTYRKGTFELPWSESNCLIGDSEALFRERGKLGKKAHANMHEPPWHLTVQDCTSYIALQFSALHTIFDAQSLELIISEVAQAYEGKTVQESIPVPTVLDPILSYSSSEANDSRKFWEDIGKEFHVTKFPDLSPVHTKSKFEVLIKSCSRTPYSLDEGCRKAGITLTAAGQLSWARILAAYTGSNDVTYGLVLSGRDISEQAQNVVFPCLTTAPAPCRLEGSNNQVLKRIMKTNVSLVKHQFTPLSNIFRWSNSGGGLFDSIFVHQKLFNSSAPAGWEILDEEARVEYPVSIELVPRASTLDFVLSCRTDVLPNRQAELLLEQLDSIFIDSIFSPDSNSTDYSAINSNLLSILPPKERKIQSSVSLLHQFVENQAESHPSNPALEFVSDVSEQGITRKVWTYQQLDEESNRYAHLLQRQGASQGGLIGICFDKCPEAHFSILAILKTGCAYVALDPTAPISRKRFIVEDSRCRIVLCTSAHSEELKSLPEVIIIATDTPGILDPYSRLAVSLDRPISPDDTSYCLYTSGTTGTPKGCEITHDNAVQAMLAFQRIFKGHWDGHSRWLQFASFHFDVSVLQQYWSWGVGICVTSCPRDVLFSDLAGVIRQLEITHIDLTPSLARLISPHEVPSLCQGVFITGGEQLKQEILNLWGDKGVVYNGYGPTEATIGCTMLPRMSRNDRPSNIGFRFDNVGSFVFKPGSNVPVMRGCAGELCVSGPLVGRGYLNRKELTEEKFQWLDDHEARIYRTGDLVRILHDGSFSFLGRIDDQVKLRGQRLEIGEINEVVRLSTSIIEDVSTLVLKHPRQPKEQLVSFVVSRSFERNSPLDTIWSSYDARLLVSQVKKACSSRLPVYMVPTHVIPMSALPLSPNNKIDSRKLKDMYESMSLETLQSISSAGSITNGEISTTTDAIICCLSTFVECSAEGIESSSNIFALGLDSISVISFAKSLRNAGFVSAEPSMVMKHPDISDLSQVLDSGSSKYILTESLSREAKGSIAAFVHSHLFSISKELGVSLGDIEGAAPCTPLQEGMIYRTLESQRQLYHSSFCFELEPSIDISRLKASWASVQSAVGVLRTRFVLTADGYAQVVMKKDRLPWFENTYSDCGKTKDNIFNYTRSHRDKTDTGFSGGNLWCVGVVRSPKKTFMSLNLFHALFDGNSLPLLLKRVTLAYVGKIDIPKTPSFLESLPYGPLSKNPKAKEFWLRHLKGFEHRSIPRSLNPPDDTTTFSELDISGLDNLETVRRTLNVTEQAILHACWLITLQQHFGHVPTIGVIVSGRSLDVENAENIIGPMFNTIPCRISFEGLSSASDLIRSCHSSYADSLPFQHTPLRDITKWVGGNPDEPLFDSLFAFQRDNEDAIQATEQLWSPETSIAEPDYPLAFEARRRKEGHFTVSIAAQSGVMDWKTADVVLCQVRDTLFEIIQNPNQELPQSKNTIRSPPQQEAHENENPHAVSGKQMVSSTTKLEWTREAKLIRDEISALAGLGKNSIKQSTSILEVGLDSIDAIKLSSRLNKADIGLSVSTIMRCRTIEKMVEGNFTPQLPKAQSNKKSINDHEKEIRASLEREGCELTGVDRVLPATPLQEAMVAEMIASDYTRYLNHEILELGEDVDLEIFKTAWVSVLNAHPIYRTSFIEVTNPSLPFTYAQIVHASQVPDWTVTHASESAIGTIIDEEKKLQADAHLARKSPLTLRLIVDGRRKFLLLSIAHALYDGWSLGLLHRDVAARYAGQKRDRPSYHRILESILDSTGIHAVDFWKGFLTGIRPVKFPKQPEAGQRSIEVHRKESKAAIPLSDINRFCKKQGITIQALGLTCWALVLAGYLGELDVLFGVVLSGRGVEKGDQIMFPTMNTVTMRGIIHGTRLGMLKYFQETVLKVSEYQHFPLRKAKPESRIGNQALFDTLFIYQKTSRDEPETFKSLYHSVGGSSDVEYPVCVEIEGVNDSLVWRLACKDDILGPSDTTSLLGRIQEIFQAILNQPDDPAVDFTENGIFVCGTPLASDEKVEKSPRGGENTVALDTEWSVPEQSIRHVLSAVSNIPEDEIPKNASLFHLGLDSISAIKVSSLLKKRSIALPVSDMLRAGTIANMARAICPGKEVPGTPGINTVLDGLLEGVDTPHLLESNGISPHSVEKVMPATAGQTYLLGMASLVDEHAFFPDFFYRAKGQLSRGRLEEAWKRLIASLPILRTAFIPTGQRELPYVQAILKEVENPIIWCGGNEFNKREPRPDISSVPVVLYACQSSEELLLKLQIHHAMYDGVSLPKIVENLAGLYNDASWHAKPKVDISDLVAFNSLHSPVEQRKQFWEMYLSGVQEKDIPRDRSFPHPEKTRCYKPGLIGHIGNIESIARRHGVSIQSLFLAAYARLHPRLVSSPNSEDEVTSSSIVIGVYLANRSHSLEGLLDLIAPALNIVPLRIRNPLGDTILNNAKRIQADLHEIGRVENSCVSLLEIADWTGIKLDTFVNFIKLPDSEGELELEGGATQYQDGSIRFVPLEASEVERYTPESEAQAIELRHPSHKTELRQEGQEGEKGIPRSRLHARPLLTQSGSSLYDEVFKPSIDVEAAVRDNRLDVGIFGPGGRISESAATDILDALRLEIENIPEVLT